MKTHCGTIAISCFLFFALVGALALCCAGSPPSNAYAEAVVSGSRNTPPPITEGVFVWVSAPEELNLGDSVTITIRIENDLRRTLKIEDIDIGFEYFHGFELVLASPEPSETDKDYGLSLSYNKNIGSGEIFQVQLQLRAVRPGIYIGDIDIWEGANFFTRVAQTRILELK